MRYKQVKGLTAWTDSVQERTPDAGVLVDDVLVKDGVAIFPKRATAPALVADKGQLFVNTAGELAYKDPADNVVPITSSGQVAGPWTVNGNNVYLNKSGNVGIGTGTTPTSKLQVVGNIEVGAANGHYYGAPTANTSWRSVRVGDDLSFQRRESAVWVEKGAFLAASMRVVGALLLVESAAPTTPAAGQGYVYVDTSGELHYIDGAQNDIPMTSGGSAPWTISGTDIYSGLAGSVGIGTGAAFTAKLDVGGSVTGAVDTDIYGTRFQTNFTEAASGTHALVAQVRIDAATLTPAAGATTNTASLYIEGPMSGATGSDYAMWVDDGISRFDGPIFVGDQGFVGMATDRSQFASTDAHALQLVRRTATNNAVADVLVVRASLTSGGITTGFGPGIVFQSMDEDSSSNSARAWIQVQRSGLTAWLSSALVFKVRGYVSDGVKDALVLDRFSNKVYIGGGWAMSTGVSFGGLMIGNTNTNATSTNWRCATGGTVSLNMGVGGSENTGHHHYYTTTPQYHAFSVRSGPETFRVGLYQVTIDTGISSGYQAQRMYPFKIGGSTGSGMSPNSTGCGFHVQRNFVEATSGVHPVFAQIYINQGTITGGAATTTATAGLYIAGPMLGGVAVTDYAMWVDDGISRFDGPIFVGDQGFTYSATTYSQFAMTDAPGAILIRRTTTNNAPGSVLVLRHQLTTGTLGDGFGPQISFQFANETGSNYGRGSIRMVQTGDNYGRMLFNVVGWPTNETHDVLMLDSNAGAAYIGPGVSDDPTITHSRFGGLYIGNFDSGAGGTTWRMPVGETVTLSFSDGGSGANTGTIYYQSATTAHWAWQIGTASNRALRIAQYQTTVDVAVDSSVTVQQRRPFYVGGTLPALSANSTWGTGAHLQRNFQEYTSGVHTLFSQLRIGIGTVAPSTGTTTATAGLYIEGPMTGITPTEDNYAIFVDAGLCRFDGNLTFNDTTSAAILFNDGADAGKIEYDHTSDYMAFSTATAEVMRIDASGRLRIGTGAATSLLDVGGDVEIGAANAYYWGDPTTDGSWRAMQSGDDLIFQQRESSVWNTKQTIPGA